jgi:glucokinase
VNLIHLLAPEVIILGGGMVEALSQLYLEEVKKTIAENVLECYSETTKLKLAALGDDAGAMGAAVWGQVRAKV